MELIRLSKDFFLQDTVSVSKNLLGKFLCRKTNLGLIISQIVEPEAYLSKNDLACHASIKKTKRNEKMFEEGGISYVYLIYGFYYCFNIVTGLKDSGEAVLIRALEPISGIDIMKSFRPVSKIKNLTNGPSKLCLALNISKKENGLNLIESNELFLADNKNISDSDIITTTRIGITKDSHLPLRFYIKNNQFVSKK